MSRIKNKLYDRSTPVVMLALAVPLLALFIAGGMGFLFVQDATRWGKFPPGSVIAGVDVSGLGRADAIRRCQEKLAGVEQKPVVLTLDGASYTASPEQLGLHLDYNGMVQNGYSAAWRPNIFERMFRSFANRPRGVSEAILAQNDDDLVLKFVQQVSAEVNQPPRNAYVDVTGGTPVIVPSRAGYQVPEEEIRKEVAAAENSKSRTIEIKAAKTPAQLNDDIFQKVIVINLAAHQLTLYQRETPLAQFGIACGQPAWPTPVGQWQIIGKQMNPTWTNPHSAWSASMPASIGPGYNNPLGLRAMPLNASGVLIHGTANDGSIGTSASHGCIRMHMPDVIALFDMVEVKTPVYIIKAPGNPGFDVTRTPSWRLKDAGIPTPSYSGD
jgi:lipoprotein-anchoring transpeptidase ErfK/SrfK